MYSFLDFVRSCKSYQEFEEFGPLVRERLLLDPFSSCLLTLALADEGTEQLLEDEGILFKATLDAMILKSCPYLTFDEKQLRNCTREQCLALYYSMKMTDYPHREMRVLLAGSEIVMPRIFLFVDDVSSVEAIPGSWLEKQGVVVSLPPTSTMDNYYPLFYQSQQTASVYYYKTGESLLDGVSPFVRVLNVSDTTPEQLVQFIEKTASDEVCGITESPASSILKEFPGWYYQNWRPSCFDLSLVEESRGSSIVALNDPGLSFDDYRRYDPEGSSDNERGDTVFVFASSWKVEVLGDFDDAKLRRFFAGRVLPTSNSSYGFCVFECLVDKGKITALRSALEANPRWLRSCLLDVLPEVRIFPLAYCPSNKAYEQFFELTANERVMRYIGLGGAWSRKKAQDEIIQAQEDTIADDGAYYHWILLDSEDNLLCYVALIKREKAGFHDIRIISRVPRRGYARRAVIFASNYFRASFARNPVKARVNTRNEASVRLFDSLYPTWRREKSVSGVIHYILS